VHISLENSRIFLLSSLDCGNSRCGQASFRLSLKTTLQTPLLSFRTVKMPAKPCFPTLPKQFAASFVPPQSRSGPKSLKSALPLVPPVSYQPHFPLSLQLTPAIPSIMDETQHHGLESALSSFHSHCLACISQSFDGLRDQLAASEAAATAQFLERYARVEDLLAGPYNRKLEWEWVPEAQPSRTISQALAQRRIRLADLPEFELPAKEYFAKFAQTSEAIINGLTQLGFYLPPCSKLFDHFLQEVLEGKRLVVAKADLRPAAIPKEQVDLAYAKTQKMISTDADLQKFLPRGVPETPADKMYFLEIVNTLRGLEYKAVLPLSEQESRRAAMLGTTVGRACGSLGRVERSGEMAECLELALRKQQGLESYGVSEYLDMYAKFHARVTELETEEMAVED